MSPSEIVQACREAVRRPDWGQKAYRLTITAVLVGVIVLCAHIVRLLWDPVKWLAIEVTPSFWASPDFGFMLTLLIASGISLAFVARSHPWQYGWIAPIGTNWWLLLPAALVGGIAGGCWAPESLVQNRQFGVMAAIGLLGMPLAVEMLFRSLTHGLLAQTVRFQRYDTRWFISWPVIGSTVLYALFVLTMYFGRTAGNVYTPLDWGKTALIFSGAVLLGLAAGMVRERSQSLWPAALFHMLAAASAFLMHYFML